MGCLYNPGEAGQFGCDGSCDRGPVSKKSKVFFKKVIVYLETSEPGLGSSFEEAKAPLKWAGISHIYKTLQT